MKKFLGLDIGTNSVGWAFIESSPEEKKGKIVAAGSRIIPMQGRDKDFEQGKSVSAAADRRMARMTRRIKHRYKLRRTRLIRVFKKLGWVPENFPENFKKHSAENGPFDINYYTPFEESTIKELNSVFGTGIVPSDWAVYFLRDKGQREQLTIRELTRVIYHFNQRRGFKSSRKDPREAKEDDPEKFPKRKTETLNLKVLSLRQTQSRKESTYELSASSADKGEITGSISLKTMPDWKEKYVTFEVTTQINKDGTQKISFKLPDPTEWQKRKEALQKEINDSGLYPGQFHLQKLLEDRDYRIKDRIIERDLYIKELRALWEKQSEFYPRLKDKEIMAEIALVLYPSNAAKQKEIRHNDLLHAIMNDVIYYQRPLKSQKHLVGECRYEKKNIILPDGRQPGVKCAPKSSPEFQEFRIWQDINSVRIYRNETRLPNGKIIYDTEVTGQLVNKEVKSKLFMIFDSSAAVNQNDILKLLFPGRGNQEKDNHRWNYPEEKEFKGNELKSLLRKAFRRAGFSEEGEKIIADPDKLYLLWHILYSLDDDKAVRNALISNFGIPENTAENLSYTVIPTALQGYASYSSKALKKLLPLLRCGEFWKNSSIHSETLENIGRFLNEGSAPNNRLEAITILKDAGLKSVEDFSGLPPHIAAYTVYGFHSERLNENKYSSPDEIKTLQRGELRNPIVEKIVNESLLVTSDIWKKFGRPDEIHIELARELKKNNKQREEIYKQNQENEKNKERIRKILSLLKGANPDSPADIDKLRLWEETADYETRTEMPKFSKEPAKNEIEKYMLWGEQNHLSPYTGRPIPLSKLFTSAYQVEHILPKARYFDDSAANKTICEAAVNRFKDKRTAMEMIFESGGGEIKFQGEKFTLLSPEAYGDHIKRIFRGKKQKYLLMDEIPEGFIERQLNDTRYITKKLGELLFPVSREDIVFTGGQITSHLRNEWGLSGVWKEILRPRFERLERMTGRKFIENDPVTRELRFLADYKRVDHRHHALDAIVCAATTRGHIQYLNTLNAMQGDAAKSFRYRYILGGGRKRFALPWDSFTKDTLDACRGIIVSFRNKSRLVSKGFNIYRKWVNDNGTLKNVFVKQNNEKLFSVRVSMFKEPFGISLLREKETVKLHRALQIQLEYIRNGRRPADTRILNREVRERADELLKNCFYDWETAKEHLKKNPFTGKDGSPLEKADIIKFSEKASKRTKLGADTTDKTLSEKFPHSDHSKLAEALRAHLGSFGGDPKTAFSEEGLSVFASSWGSRVNQITVTEEIGKKILLHGKYFETDKGGNLFYALYENTETGERKGETLSILDTIDRLKKGLPPAPQIEGWTLTILSPNDLVILPDGGKSPDNVYRVVKFTKKEIHFKPHYISARLEKSELGSNDCAEKSWDLKGDSVWSQRTIVKTCSKINVDRLGFITES